jgi:hypothetical protein
MIPKPLIWLCEEAPHSLTANRIFRNGSPDLANFVLLPKPLELSFAARFVKRTIFTGLDRRISVLRGHSDRIAGNRVGITDALELVVMVKAISLISGEAFEF